MSNVISFPETMHREWRVLEKQVRPVLLELGASPEEAEHALEAVRPVWIEYGREAAAVPFDAQDVEGAIRAMNAFFSSVNAGLVSELLRREVELFRLRRSAD